MRGRRIFRGGRAETTANFNFNYREGGQVILTATDDRTHLQIFEATFTAEEFVELTRGMGGPREVPVIFFAPEFIGKYHSHESYEFPVLDDDETGRTDRPGPTTQAKIDALEGGTEDWEWVLDTPRVNNRRQWVVIRRRYTDEPVPEASSLNPDPTPSKSKKKKTKEKKSR